MAKQLDDSLISTLFRVADADRDGAVGGVEAVQFFARSGLPQESLGQVSVMALALRAWIDAARLHGQACVAV